MRDYSRLHSDSRIWSVISMGSFWSGSRRASYRWHPRNLSWHCASPSWSLPSIRSISVDVKHISCFVKNTANMRAGFTSEGLEVVDLVRDTKHLTPGL